MEGIIHYPTKASTTTTTTGTPRLKIFGFHVSEEEECSDRPISSTTTADSTTTLSSSTVTAADGRKYECQYCCREFANSQALGGHQNAHKKERQQLKRAQMHHHHSTAGGRFMVYPRNPIVSSFSSPTHLLPTGAAHVIHQPVASSSRPPTTWVYCCRSAPPQQPFRMSHGCVAQATVPGYGEEEERSTSAGMKGRPGIAGPYHQPPTSMGYESYPSSLSRFSSSAAGVVVGAGNNADDVRGLDLHLSLAPAGSS